jgi:hypothetical protein
MFFASKTEFLFVRRDKQTEGSGEPLEALGWKM